MESSSDSSAANIAANVESVEDKIPDQPRRNRPRPARRILRLNATDGARVHQIRRRKHKEGVSKRSSTEDGYETDLESEHPKTPPNEAVAPKRKVVNSAPICARRNRLPIYNQFATRARDSGFVGGECNGLEFLRERQRELDIELNYFLRQIKRHPMETIILWLLFNIFFTFFMLLLLNIRIFNNLQL